MKSNDSCETNDPLDIALGASKPISVSDHHAIRREMLAGLLHERDFDDIDLEVDELIQVDPYLTGTNNRRSDKELARMLDIIDSLPTSSNGKEGDH